MKPMHLPMRPFGLVALLLAFSASASRAAVARPAVADTTNDSLLYISEVIVGRSPCIGCPPRACVTEPVPVTVRGGFPNGCYSFRGLRELPVAAPFPVLLADIVYEACGGGCPDIAGPFTGKAELPPPGFPGTHSFLLIEQVRGCPDSTSIISSRSRMITYEVVYPCVPPDSIARSLVNISVSPARPCPGDSLRLIMAKNGCPPCVDLTGLEFDIEGRFHGTLDWRPGCLEFACIPETLSVPLGVFAAGHHVVSGIVDVHVLAEPAPDSTISFLEQVAFEVPAECDTTTPPCMLPFLFAGALRDINACALTVEPGRTGTLALSAMPTVPLGGFEGRIDCSPPFRILRAHAFPGMDDVHVFSTPEGRGIRYVVLADLRNPIPAGKGPVMQLEIAADADAPPGARGGLFARITLASDVNGDSVVLCDHRLIDPAPIALCVAGDGGQCDVNGDGRGDVRDLVLMTRCFDLVLTPPDSARVCPDCDGDTAFTLSDLLCCARDILRAPLVPRDSVRSDARVSVSFDPVEVVGSNLIVPVRVRGLRELGAAVLRLSYPGNRWRAIAQIALPAGLGPVDWYPIVDVFEPGSIHLGGLRLGDAGPDEFTFVLAMEPLPVTYLDHPPGIDRLETVGADLAARDGSVITPKAGLPSIVLDLDATPRGALELSSPRPNPFGTSTTFFVRLPEAGLVDLAVHDIAGRRIATIAHSTYEAGEHPFTWDGDGARDGVYFVRLTVNGQVLTSRVAMLRESR